MEAKTIISDFKEIMDKYPKAMNENQKGHPLANKMRNDFKDDLKSLVESITDSSYNFRISPGMMGRWTNPPWAGIISSTLPDKFTDGLYVIYHFNYEKNIVDLSINQGLDNIKRSEAINIAKKLRKNADFIDGFSLEDDPDFRNSQTAVLYKKYDINNIDSEIFSNDLKNLLQVYEKLLPYYNDILNTSHETIGDVSMGNKINYWLYAPGNRASKWDEYYEKGIMGMGSYNIGDLHQYESKEKIVKKIQRVNHTRSKYTHESLALWQFANEIKPGDIIFVKKGAHEIVGYGIVQSEYFYDTTLDDEIFCHMIRVDWKEKGNWKYRGTLATKTLTKITNSTDLLNTISGYFESFSIQKSSISNINTVINDSQDEYDIVVNMIKRYLLENNLGRFEQKVAVNESNNFIESYSPEALRDMDDEDILNKIFPHDSDKSTMSYYLEYVGIFGGIRGGYPTVYGIYKSSQTNSWVMGSGKNRKTLNKNEAIKIARSIIDALSNGVKLIKNTIFTTVEDYVNLEKELTVIFKDCPVSHTYSWVHKYFSLICPEVIPVIHQDKMKKDMIRKFHITPLKGYYANDAQLYFLSKDAGINLFSLFHEDIVSLFYHWDDHMWVGFDENNLIDLNGKEMITPKKDSNFKINPSKVKTDLKINKNILYQTAAILNSPKNIILEGVPGTGKTRLAKDICEYAKNENFCDDYLITTATSDWTTFDVIGGLMPDTNGNLNFEEGIFLKAIRENKLLIIDEINRADIDKAFGQLFTVLSGFSVELNYKIDGINISIDHCNELNSYYDNSSKTYFIGENFRILATMNNYDKDSLYELSYAFMRRFAFVEVDIPNDEDFAGLIDIWNNELTVSLPQELIEDLKILLDIRHYRKLGPAIFHDMMNYMENRLKFDSIDYLLEETILSFILPQFEGLNRNKLSEIKNLLVTNNLVREEIVTEKFNELSGLNF